MVSKMENVGKAHQQAVIIKRVLKEGICQFCKENQNTSWMLDSKRSRTRSFLEEYRVLIVITKITVFLSEGTATELDKDNGTLGRII